MQLGFNGGVFTNVSGVVSVKVLLEIRNLKVDTLDPPPTIASKVDALQGPNVQARVQTRSAPRPAGVSTHRQSSARQFAKFEVRS